MIPKTSHKVYQSKNKITIESPWRDDDLVLEISTLGTKEVSRDLIPNYSEIISTTDIMGIIGVIQLSFCKYLLVVTRRELSCTLQSHKIWKITGAEAISIGDSSLANVESLNPEDLGRYAVDLELMSSIMHTITSGRLFYSLTYDLSHSLQHNYFSKEVMGEVTIVDDRYFFNKFLSSFLQSECSASSQKWIARIIAGFAGAIDIDYCCEEKNNSLKTILVSRINHRRLGTRYVRRGLDNEGNAANNVEMEQIVFHRDYLKNKRLSSFCQLRGSVPTIWGQDLDLSYRPRLILTDIKKKSIWDSSVKHFEDLIHQYKAETSFSSDKNSGCVVCVNLLDDSGFEGPLSEIYENCVNMFNDPKIRYEGFPMHKWCKKGNYSNMDILLDRIRLPIINSGWFSAEGDVPSLDSKGTLKVTNIQTGVMRVSCLDSLDRTNLTCSIFARFMLPFQVHSISLQFPEIQGLPSTGVSASEVRDPVSTTRKALESSYQKFKNLWADSGDFISIMYAGTGALKADVTRTGKRQVFTGSYNDGMNSLTRYYLNNFTHGNLQDCYDLITGKINASQVIAYAGDVGEKKANRLKNPLISRSSILGTVIPKLVMDSVEPIYFNMREAMENGKKRKEKSISSVAVSTLKDLAPHQIESIFQLIFALHVFFWIFIITKWGKIKGQLVVDFPKLSKRDRDLFETD